MSERPANLTPPTAELHVHIEGTLEPETIWELATRSSIELPYEDIDDLRSRYRFEDLQSFLDLYYQNMQVLVTAQDFADMTSAYLQRAAVAGVKHVELFFDPQAHMARGVELTTVVDGIFSALAESTERYGMSSSLIACFMRDRDPAEAMHVLQQLLEMEAPVIGIGLDSAERDYPPRLFEEIFALARSNGLRLVAHAGEEGPADYVRQALDVLRVERVDHGVQSLADPELVARLVREQIPLTVCPLSNVALRGVPTLAEHPLPAMLEAGLKISVHSDDPAYFGGYVDTNYTAIQGVFGLSREQLAQLARNAVDSSFISPSRTRELHGEIDRWLAE
ncbi:adenosine deaminase [Nesterenkonia haasae]|uniref:adenosine deaminase n=1 Tax=Nesterenkonia haasae TaxID=2587813 RepID=UPI001390DDD9|nr:adenosine deaminase [Nesterenkonia haasae]NDK31107.1 adenosine deaminase [Nesterenkonia haasae]